MKIAQLVVAFYGKLRERAQLGVEPRVGVQNLVVVLYRVFHEHLPDDCLSVIGIEEIVDRV